MTQGIRGKGRLREFLQEEVGLEDIENSHGQERNPKERHQDEKEPSVSRELQAMRYD